MRGADLSRLPAVQHSLLLRRRGVTAWAYDHPFLTFFIIMAAIEALRAIFGRRDGDE